MLSKEYTEETLFHLMSYTTQNGTVLSGLVKRRIAEAMIFAGLGYPKISNGDFYGNAEYKKLLFDYANQFDIGEYNNRICKCLE